MEPLREDLPRTKGPGGVTIEAISYDWGSESMIPPYSSQSILAWVKLEMPKKKPVAIDSLGRFKLSNSENAAPPSHRTGRDRLSLP